MIVAAYNLLEVLSIFLCISYLYNQKFRLDIVSVSVISLDIILMQTISYYNLSYELTFLMYPLLIGYCILEYKADIRKIVVNTILFVVILAALQYFAMAIFIFFTKTRYIDETGIFIINLLLFIIVLLPLKKCRIVRLSNYLQDKGRILLISIFFCFITIFLCLMLNKQRNIFNIVMALVISVSTILICALAASLGKFRIKAIEAEAELKVHKLYESSFNTLIENIRMKQHEFDNHINTIYSQHHIYKTYDELVHVQEEYCHQLENENKYNKLLSVGNSVILGFLYGKFTEMEKYNINFSYKVYIQEFNCNVPIYKIIEILGNLINNAVDAAKQNLGNTRLFISVIEHEDTIELEVRNESRKFEISEIQKFFEKGFSHKGNNRGLGLYNVKRICTEYRCEISCSNQIIDDSNWITFQVKMKKPTK